LREGQFPVSSSRPSTFPSILLPFSAKIGTVHIQALLTSWLKGTVHQLRPAQDKLHYMLHKLSKKINYTWMVGTQDHCPYVGSFVLCIMIRCVRISVGIGFLWILDVRA
jgi:hypothetical protein